MGGGPGMGWMTDWAATTTATATATAPIRLTAGGGGACSNSATDSPGRGQALAETGWTRIDCRNG